MKKILTVFLTVCLIATMATMLAVGTFAEEAEDIEVTVGQSFEWNATESSRTWLQSKGVSPDGLWKYQMYALEREIYQDLNAIYGGGFAWSTTPGDDGVGYARVRRDGTNFHPGKTADVVKTFICPSGGTIEVNSVVTRENAVSDGATGTSFAVYLDDTLVYPTDGTEYLVLNSNAPQNVTFTVDVAKNQHLRFHIGGIEGHIGGDSTNMTNVVTYKAINDSVSDGSSEGTLTFTRITNTVSLDPLGLNNVSNNQSGAGNGGNTGLIIGIVVGVVAVVAVAVVVVIVIKKRQE